MRIGIVLSNTPSYSETFFNSKIKGLQGHGYTVVLYTQSKASNFSLCPVKTAPPIFKRNIIKQMLWFIWVFFKLLFYPKPVIKFVKLEKQQRNPITAILKKVYINAHLLSEQLDWLHFGFATMALGKENVAKSIDANMAVSLRGFDIAIYPIKHPHCYDLLWQRVDKIHTISDDLYTLAIKNGLNSMVSFQKITPAINIKNFNTTVQLIKSNQQKQFITVARLHWKKGLTYTLSALKLLKEQGVDFHYTIVGEGDEFEKLMYIRHQLGLDDSVTFLGKVAHKEVEELLKEHEIYLQYSISEGFCNSVLEAQAMGLLCIVSDAEGLPENVLHEKSGWVVPKRNPQKLAETIVAVSKMASEEKNRIKEFAINRVQKEFNLKKQQQEFVNFYSLEV